MLEDKEILEGNLKIAKFMGYPQNETDDVVIVNNHSYTYDQLKFHFDWNWLMDVVKKLEDMGFCVHSANYCKTKEVKDNLNAHIGFDLGDDDYYCDISGSVNENNTHRYFQIQRLDAERLESLWRTIVMFIDFYNDKSVKIVNVDNGKVVRKE